MRRSVAETKSMAERIFIVDDMPDFLELMEDVLSEAGYEVTTFPSTAEAAQAAHTSPPHLIITDLRMGEDNGFDLLRTMQQDPTTRHVPLLVCTAATMDVEERGRAPGIGGVPVIYKPFDLRDFLDRVRGLLEGAPAT